MQKYETVINNFDQLRVLVIGDAMLDVYFKGHSQRLCREAPVPVVDVADIVQVPGGAANTAVNLASLGARVSFLSVIGNDSDGEVLLSELKRHHVDTDSVIKDTERKTLVKKRILSDNHLIVRYDMGSGNEVGDQTATHLIQHLEKTFHLFDAVVISDYGYGVLQSQVIEALATLQRQQKQTLIVDAKFLPLYCDVHPTAVKPNYGEVVKTLNLESKTGSERLEQLKQQQETLLRVTGAEIVAATVDVDGALILQAGNQPYKTETVAMPNSQAAGAGDTYVSGLTLALASGLTAEDAAEVAAAAAKVVVRKSGTSCCTPQELKRELHPESTKSYQEQQHEWESILLEHPDLLSLKQLEKHIINKPAWM